MIEGMQNELKPSHSITQDKNKMGTGLLVND